MRGAEPIDRAKRASDSDAFADRFDAVEVGASLREARILLRRSLPDVARDLRIRHAYLLAIEEGRLEDLPGVAYQTGFLRAYGNYLGLDGDGLAEDLREARDASGDRDPLQVFSPIDEGHLPTRSIFLVAALLAIAVYGVWYFVSNTDGDPVERVAALPDRLAALLDDEPAEEDEPAATDPATVVPPSGPATGPASPTPEPSTPAVEPSDTPPSAEPAAGTTAPEPVAEVPPNATEPPAEDGGTRTPPAPDRNEADPPIEIAAATLPAPARPIAQDPGTTLETPAADVQEEAVSRIVLRAATESWIEIRTDDASLVYSGLLRQGQSYSVPQRPGLKMVTGNAGGLEIVVDGKAIPRLGPPGAVVRDIALDPDSLRGRAGP